MQRLPTRIREYFSLYQRLANVRIGAAIIHDTVSVVLAWYFAFALRFNFQIPPAFSDTMLTALAWLIPLQVLFFINFGLYQGVWRFASLPDLKRIIFSVFASTATVVAIIYMFQPQGVVPRSVLILDPLLLILAMGGSRFIYRYWKEHRLYGSSQVKGEPVLLLGAGEAAINLLKDLTRSEEWRVVGLLDDDPAMQGRHLLGIRVLGGLDKIPDYARSMSIKHVIVAIPLSTKSARRKAIDLANMHGLTVLTLPSLDDLISGKVSVSQIRRVEVEDLLGREPVVLDGEGLHKLIDSHSIMVTGAGGSIGSELCRQIIRYRPAHLICFDISEFSLYKLEQEFSASFPHMNITYLVGDIRNEARITGIIGEFKPNMVFHAAAYKHVPLMEKSNVAEALNNNVVGTYTLAKVCKEMDVQKFVMVSTDKAVNPTNVMGANKRLAEMVCQGMQEKSGTRFVIVRFGNVLGSSGSVIPKFREQIARGGPVTVTHPEITRYFMSIPEAAQLVMQAGLMGTGAEIFVMDMGESVKIADLARDMIKLSGLHVDDIEIHFTGLRPGEKLYEELLADDEHTLPTPHEKLRIAIARTADKAWVKALLKWIASSNSNDEDTIKDELSMWVEEYVGDINAGKPEAHATLAPRSSTIH